MEERSKKEKEYSTSEQAVKALRRRSKPRDTLGC